MEPLSVEDIQNCRSDQGIWICPVCRKHLSRKQTLISHLVTIHSIEGGYAGQYKKHKYITLYPEPYTSKARRLATENSEENSNATLVGNNGHEEDADGVPLVLDLDNTEITDMDISDNEDSEKSDAEECSDDESVQTRSEYTPLYVIPPSSSLYEANISSHEHRLTICAYASKFNLSGTAFQQLMQLIKLHLPQENICETNVQEVKNACGFDGDYIKYHDYCDQCGFLYTEDRQTTQCPTPACGIRRYANPDSKHGKHFFVTGDAEKQLHEVLTSPENWEHLKSSRERPAQETIYDIQDGENYKKWRKQGEFLEKDTSMNISVTMFTDGVALFKSSKSSFWPVYLVINELPPKQRFLRRNMVLWGLWQGTSKPKLNTFLHPFVVDMKKLYKDGTTVEYEGTHYIIKVVVAVATMDLQARASLLNSVPHNAEYGCIYCEEPGFTVPSGKGYCRHYPYRNKEDQAPPRTEQSIQVNVEMALAAKKAVKGFAGKTVMKFLPEFQLPESVAIDYMHGILLGVMKKLMSLWFDGKYHQLPFYIGHRLEDVDKILSSVKPPYQINRTPRKISGNVQHWKASEFRSWLLFYCIPCLKGILPDVYLTHLACLVEGIFILLSDSIPLDKLDRAEKLLQNFYGNFVELYGEAAAGLNVHNILHLAMFVKKWGPIWAYSCFAFESFNGELSKTVHGKGNVCGEIFWAVQREKIIASEVKYVKNPPVNIFLNGLLQLHDSEASYEIGFQCLVKKPLEKVEAHQLPEQIKSELRHFIDNMENKELCKCKKVIRNDHTFFSEKCGKVKQRNSFTIKLEKVRESVAYVQTKCFIMDKGTKRVYAVCKGFSVQGTLIPRRVPSVLQVKLEREIVVVPVEDLKEHVVFFQTSSGTVIAEFPNFIERD